MSAQEEVPPSSEEVAPTGGSPTDRVVYGPDFFSRYSVNNAEDMLRLVPGVQTILNATQETRRGFGSGGAQILLNGRRFPGKSNEINGNLRRIPAPSVARVELVSGAAQDISVNSEGILVNVVLREGASLKGSGSWEANARVNDESASTQFDGLLSYNGSAGALGYSLGIERNVWSPPSVGSARWSTRYRDEIIYYADGTPQEVRAQDWDRDHDKWIYTGGLSYNFAGGSRFDLNGLLETRDVYQDDVADFTRYAPGGVVTLQGQDVHQTATKPARIVEVGGEFEGRIGPGGFNALFIVRRERNDNIDYRNLVTPGNLQEINRTVSHQEAGEDIVRASYGLPLVQGQTLEFGAEVARNQLDQDLLAYFDSDNNGVLEITPNQYATVKEDRSELFVTHKWTITDALSLESALNYEMSKLTSNYHTAGIATVTPERKLEFPKPRFDMRYRASPQIQYRMKIERKIGQLDFNNFVPRLNFSDNIIIAGNPALEPQKTWIYELGHEWRLPGDAGLIETRVFYNDITDVVDKAPMQIAPGRIVAVQGNIPSATGYGGEVKSSIRLGFIRMPDALLSLRYMAESSKSEDPFTGERRRRTNDRGYEFEVNYRQYVRSIGASFGFTYSDTGNAAYSSDLIGPNVVRQYMKIDPVLEAFVEKSLFGSTVLRIEAQNLTGSREWRRRSFTPLATPAAPAVRSDFYGEDRDVRVAIRLRGQF
ncbi:MAG: TonB-dependent receptor [Steroidobacteraceae bacterium]